jgi:hypothetical protein
MKELTTVFGQNFAQRVIFFSFLFVFSFLSFAQEGEKDNRYGGYARLHSMGDNPYIVDPDNIKLNPAYSSTYSNFLWGDIGANNGNPEGGQGQFAGFSYGFNDQFTLGFLLTRSDFMTSYAIGGLDPRDLAGQINDETGANVVPLNNNFELLGSYNFGNFVLGLGVAYASTTNDFTPDSGNGGYQNSASQFGVNLGVMGKLSSKFKFDAAFSVVLPSVAYEPDGAGALKIEASNTDIFVNARGFWSLSNKVTLVPTVGFLTSSGTAKNGAQSFDLPSWMGFLVGVGLHYQVGDLLIAGGPSFMYESETIASTDTSPEEINSRTTFPGWNLGAEWYFTDWLVGRLGYVASTFSGTYQSAASQASVNEFKQTGFGEGDVRLGVGFRFGGFNLDATVNDDALRQGFNLVGGGVASFAYLSASYAF